MKQRGVIIAGIVVGLLAVLLVYSGNAANYGLCVACFIRDTVGALGLHRAAVVQYIRPEVIGIVLGAFFMSMGAKEFNTKGGSAPFTRFVLGFLVIVGALMFLGCPLRMILRLAGGDLNAIFGILGFSAGIGLGIFSLNRGFSLKRTYKMATAEGYLFPAVNVGLLALLVAAPAFIFFSTSGPGAARAPIWLALAAGLVVGVAAQRTRLCMVGGIRDIILFKDWYLVSGFLAVFVAALIGNFFTGQLNIGFAGQPIAHTNSLWNFLGMALAGWGSVLLGGCPLRQLILAGEGNVDSVISVMGMAAGAAFAHNFGLAASPAGPTSNGQVAVLIGFVVVGLIAYLNVDKSVGTSKVKGDVSLEATTGGR